MVQTVFQTVIRECKGKGPRDVPAQILYNPDTTYNGTHRNHRQLESRIKERPGRKDKHQDDGHRDIVRRHDVASGGQHHTAHREHGGSPYQRERHAYQQHKSPTATHRDAKACSLSPTPYPQRQQQQMQEGEEHPKMQAGKRQDVRRARKAVELALSARQHGAVAQGHGSQHTAQFLIEIATVCHRPPVAFTEHTFTERHVGATALVHHATAIGHGYNSLPTQMSGIVCRNVGKWGEKALFRSFQRGLHSEGIPHLGTPHAVGYHEAQLSASVAQPHIGRPRPLQHGGGGTYRHIKAHLLTLRRQRQGMQTVGKEKVPNHDDGYHQAEDNV